MLEERWAENQAERQECFLRLGYHLSGAGLSHDRELTREARKACRSFALLG
jgi:hypothetical protein